jgi:hypothetical protein
MKFTFIKRSFEEEYGNGYSLTNYSGIKNQQRITTTASYVYFHDCVFSNCLSSSNGGSIYCSSNVNKLLVEQSTFISCATSSGSGGGVYFCNSAGESILSRICGFNCSATSSGHLAYISTKDDANFKNYAKDSSISHCIKLSSNTYSTLRLEYGNNICPSINLTNNVCACHCAIRCYNSVSSTSETTCLSYSSIINNTADVSNGCIDFNRAGSSQRIDTCNVINNNDSSSYYGIFYISSNLLIKDSCILGNNLGKKVFYLTSSGKLTLSNCTIDDDIFSGGRYTGSVSISKTVERKFINALSHIVTQKCDSYFDSYGTLTGKPNIPSRSSRCLMSCVYDHAVINPFRVIKLLLLLTILPSDPSSDYYFNSNCYLHLTFVNK